MAEEPASKTEELLAQSRELLNELGERLSGEDGTMVLDAEPGESPPADHDYTVRRDRFGGWVPRCSCGWAGRAEREEAVALFRWTRHADSSCAASQADPS